MNTVIERAGSYHSSRRFNISPKKLIASGLISVALMAAGCGDMSKEERNKKIEANEDKTEEVLKNAFYPAMAELGKKAARFAKKHKDAAIWYEIIDGQKRLSLFDENNKHTVDITMRKGVGNNNFQPGDVNSILINTNSTSVRVEADVDDKPCSKGIAASSNYFNPLDGDDGLSSFISTNRCFTRSVGLGFDEDLDPKIASIKIIDDMDTNFQKVMQKIKAD